MTKLLPLELDGSAKAPLAEQIRKGISHWLSRAASAGRFWLGHRNSLSGQSSLIERWSVRLANRRSVAARPALLQRLNIENQIDSADVFEDIVLEVDELLRAEVERLLTVGSASGADDVGAELTCELRDHRPDCAGCAVHEDALPRLKTAMLEQSLPRSQARLCYARAHREVDVARQRREVACLDGHILRQGAAAIRVREAEHPLSHRQPRRAVAESGNHSGQLLPGNNRRPVTA